MTRIESELHDLYECLMRNDDMADRDTYHTIVGIANDVAEVETENAKLRRLVRTYRACHDHVDACRGCSELPDCEALEKMRSIGREVGIEVDENE